MLDFNTLIAPHSREEFFAGYWPDRPCLVSSNADRTAAFSAAVPELDSAERLLSIFPAKVGLMSPKGFRASLPDGRTAIPFLRQGFTCYLKGVEQHVPALHDLLDVVSVELGFPRKYMICEVFCSNGESGTAMHGDYDLNFAMQLHGTKHWKLAPNEHIRNITTQVYNGGLPQRDPGQLRLATKLPFPDRMPDDCIEFTARDGGLVFLPRDWWHQTHATGECLQLNVVVKGPMWLTVLTESLSEALVTRTEWRDMAFGVAGEDEAAVKTFAAMLGRLRTEFAGATDLELARTLLAAVGYRRGE